MHHYREREMSCINTTTAWARWADRESDLPALRFLSVCEMAAHVWWHPRFVGSATLQVCRPYIEIVSHFHHET